MCIKLNKRLWYEEHNFEYLEIFFYNLKEKYQRKQKDFNDILFKSLSDYYFEMSNIIYWNNITWNDIEIFVDGKKIKERE